MEKKTYIQPTQRIMVLRQEKMLLAGSDSVKSVSNNIDLDYEGDDSGYTGGAR